MCGQPGRQKTAQQPCRTAPMNPRATLLLKAAGHDYAAARCLLLNGLVSGGLATGAEAVEKFLKAHILVKNPQHNVRKLNHSLAKLLELADKLSPELGLSDQASLMDRFEKYYNSRYPDNQVVLPGMYSSEISPLDEFIIYLNEHTPMLAETKLRTGLYAIITSSLHLKVVPPWEFWIKCHNVALAPLLPQIEREFRMIVLKN
jgi:HEPN domain-containing protein